MCDLSDQPLPDFMWLSNLDVTYRAVKSFTTRTKLESQYFGELVNKISTGRDPTVRISRILKKEKSQSRQWRFFQTVCSKLCGSQIVLFDLHAL